MHSIERVMEGIEVVVVADVGVDLPDQTDDASFGGRQVLFAERLVQADCRLLDLLQHFVLAHDVHPRPHQLVLLRAQFDFQFLFSQNGNLLLLF